MPFSQNLVTSQETGSTTSRSSYKPRLPLCLASSARSHFPLCFLLWVQATRKPSLGSERMLWPWSQILQFLHPGTKTNLFFINYSLSYFVRATENKLRKISVSLSKLSSLAWPTFEASVSSKYRPWYFPLLLRNSPVPSHSLLSASPRGQPNN